MTFWHPCRVRAQVVGKVKLEVEYVPFKVAADAKAQLARQLTRTMSRSKINADHKGVLTVNLIKATNLAVGTRSWVRVRGQGRAARSTPATTGAHRQAHQGHQPGGGPFQG